MQIIRKSSLTLLHNSHYPRQHKLAAFNSLLNRKYNMPIHIEGINKEQQNKPRKTVIKIINTIYYKILLKQVTRTVIS